MRDGLAQFEGEPLAKVQRHHHQQHQHQIDARMEINARQVPSRNRAVDGLADHPRQRGQLQAARKGQHKQPVAPRGVPPGVSEHAADELGAERRVVGLPLLHGPEVSDRLACAAELVTEAALPVAWWMRARS